MMWLVRRGELILGFVNRYFPTMIVSSAQSAHSTYTRDVLDSLTTVWPRWNGELLLCVLLCQMS